jgi:hypothetical protein
MLSAIGLSLLSIDTIGSFNERQATQLRRYDMSSIITKALRSLLGSQSSTLT